MRVDTAWTWITKRLSSSKHPQNQLTVNSYYAHTLLGTMYLSAYVLAQGAPFQYAITQNGGVTYNLGFGLENGLPGHGWAIDGNIRLIDSLATLTLEGLPYTRIHVFALDSSIWSVQTLPIFKECWWVKDVGLVRYKLNTGQTCTLKTWHSEPFWPLP